MKRFVKHFLIPALITFAILVFFAQVVHAQPAQPISIQMLADSQQVSTTNQVVAYLSGSSTPTSDVVEVRNASEAFAAMLHFSGVSGTTITLIFIVLHLLARSLRNTVLKNCSPDTAGIVSKIVAIAGGKPLEMPASAAVQSAQTIQPGK